MRSWTIGLLCVALAVYVAARYQDQNAEAIDTEVETLEREARALNDGEVAGRMKRDFDLDDLTEEEIEHLLESIENSRRSFNEGHFEKKLVSRRARARRLVRRNPTRSVRVRVGK